MEFPRIHIVVVVVVVGVRVVVMVGMIVTVMAPRVGAFRDISLTARKMRT